MRTTTTRTTLLAAVLAAAMLSVAMASAPHGMQRTGAFAREGGLSPVAMASEMQERVGGDNEGVDGNPFGMLVETQATANARATTRAMTSTELFMGLMALKAEVARSKAGLPSCSGLVEKMCDACPPGGAAGSKAFCDNIKKTCSDIFCQTMCRRMVWKCKVTFGSLKIEKKDPRFEDGLCAQFIQYGCEKMLKCCPKDDLMWQYIDDHAFGKYYPQPFAPSPTCKSGPNPKSCGKCKGAVKIKLKKNHCNFPSLASRRRLLFAENVNAAKTTSVGQEVDSNNNNNNHNHVGANGMDEEELEEEDDEDQEDWSERNDFTAMVQEDEDQQYYDYTEPVRKPDSLGEAETMEEALLVLRETVDARVVERVDAEHHALLGTKQSSFPGVSKFENLQTRCLALTKKWNAKKGSMKSKFKKNACQCLGCCKGPCFYPIVEQFNSGGIEEEK